MRDLINIVSLNEADLEPGELSKYNGKYLEILIQLIGTGVPLMVAPKSRALYGDQVEIDPGVVAKLKKLLADPATLRSKLPVNLPLKTGGTISTSKLFKGPEFTGRAGKKSYNTGHLAELFVGAAVFTKFANRGEDITVNDVIANIQQMQQSVYKDSFTFDLVTVVSYPEPKSKKDQLTFRALVPGVSAQAFMDQLHSNKIAPDLQNTIASAVAFANHSEGVNVACSRVRSDLGSNSIEVVSDGSSDAKGTKADMVLKIDGTKINLLSLKTDSKTLGQSSGTKYDNIYKFFNIGLGIDISEYQALLDPTHDKDTLFKNICKIYDTVVYPQVQAMVDRDDTQSEVGIINRLAKAANIFARGETLEDVDIVKLDDSIKSGNFKVMRYSDSLYETMRELDLYVNYTKREGGRTIQFLVKPNGAQGNTKSNLLCQFRSQFMGGYLRNYFEVGEIMEALVTVEKHHQNTQQVGSRTPAKRSTNIGLGRERR